ncbi:MAG: regulator of protease activity HflC (stomatin/prohibitin superfamily) [Candidatus Paceibacteria bacterium]|jgi:regulator of protease activity HflC (stomatin/prohibitin superfamily)
MAFFYIIFLPVALIVFGFGVRIVRPTQRAVIERLGKYRKFGRPGFHWIIPIVDQMIKVDVTENMADIAAHEIITEDNLNAKVDMMIYFQVKDDEDNVKRSLYEVSDFARQIVSLAQTTARNVIGGMAFKDVNSRRATLNEDLATILRQETGRWGVEVVRVELKEIIPPTDVQETMNMVIKAENSKRSAVDFATAKETEADGFRRAAIKEAEGERQSAILQAEGYQQATILRAEGEKQAAVLDAEGQATAFDLTNQSFVGNAQVLKKLQVTENSLDSNAKIILTENGISPSLILDARDDAGGPIVVGRK